MIHTKEEPPWNGQYKYVTGQLKPVKRCTNLTLSSDVDQDTNMFGLHEIPLTYQCIIS